MSKTRRWLALAFVAALFLGALAPTAAHAYKSDRPTDLPGDPLIEPPLQYGDPDPTGSGSPVLITYLSAWRQILIASMRIQLALPLEPASAAMGPTTKVGISRYSGKRQ